MINIEPIKAFSDNYIWLLTTNEGSIVIDPGESKNLLKILSQNKLDLKAIFITHHHFDHTGGIKEILSKKSIDVYGPKNKIDSINIRVVNESKISLFAVILYLQEAVEEFLRELLNKCIIHYQF